MGEEGIFPPLPCFMELAIADPHMARVLEREIRKGFQLEREMEKHRVEGAAYEARELRNMQKAGGDFKAVTSIPNRDFWRLVRKYGHDEVHSNQFQRYLHKKIPDSKIANV